MADKLFLTDAEIAGKLGIKTTLIKEQFALLERSGFPLKDPQFDDRRYWPAVKAWLDRRFRVASFSETGNSARKGY